MVKPLKDILKEIETRRFWNGGSAEDWSVDLDVYDDDDGGWEPDPDRFQTYTALENLPDHIADINRDATLTEEYTTESPIDKSVRD